MEKLLAFVLTLFQNPPITEHSKLDSNIFQFFLKKCFIHENMSFLSHDQTHLDIMTNVIFTILVFLTPQPQKNKIKFHFDALKEANTNFQVRAFNHKAFLKH